MRDAVIVDAVRLASGKGKPGGALSTTHPTVLLSTVLREIVARNDLDASRVDDVLAGCVLQVGEQSLNIARNAVLGAGFPAGVPAATIDRQCGSSQQAVHFAAQGVLAGAYDIAIAAGVESMSRVPMGTSTLDQDAYGSDVAARFPDGLVGQGISAELIAAKWGFRREELDEYAARSHRLATENIVSGWFDQEIVPIETPNGIHKQDETVRASTTAEGLAALTPSFYNREHAARFPEIDWRITAGNSSPLTDGASAALIMGSDIAEALGLKPRARFHSFALAGDDPILMLTAPIPATRRVLEKAGLTVDDIDAFEVNEAFASVPLAWAKELGVPMEKLNPRGGAIALGHALGSSGTRLLTTLLRHLESTGGRYGLQVMCEAGGMANATIIERL
ncbi:thiolase family protein [Pseudarthrobacter siccitolerans]